MVLQLTKDEVVKLEKQLEHLKLVERPKVIERLQIARSYGDLSENSEYDAARDEQAFVEREISEIEEKIRTAEIISADDMADNVASLGKLVTVRESDTGNVITYEIVGVMSTDPFAFKISKECPIGMALQGHEEGITVHVETPVPAESYDLKILKIEKVEDNKK